MAFDEGLAERVRALLDGQPGLTEKRMFGGVAFMLGGNMFVGIVKADLMVRVGRPHHREALRDRHARTMDFTGRPMEGYVFVAPEGTAEEADLARWIGMGRSFAATLPEKGAGARPARRPGRASASARKPTSR